MENRGEIFDKVAAAGPCLFFVHARCSVEAP